MLRQDLIRLRCLGAAALTLTLASCQVSEADGSRILSTLTTLISSNLDQNPVEGIKELLDESLQRINRQQPSSPFRQTLTTAAAGLAEQCSSESYPKNGAVEGKCTTALQAAFEKTAYRQFLGEKDSFYFLNSIVGNMYDDPATFGPKPQQVAMADETAGVAKFRQAMRQSLGQMLHAEIDLFPTIHFSKAGAAVCLSLSARVRPTASPLQFELADYELTKDEVNPEMGYMTIKSWFLKSESNPTDSYFDFYRLRYVGGTYDALTSAYRSLVVGMVGRNSASLAKGSSFETDGPECFAAQKSCRFMRGADFEDGASCPVATLIP